ncbi:biopolymer transporter ExbD [Maribacter sp. SA7]|uniref:ExbD/TolR family protein n=1 Tax=Maribacter zhoushanensis TaxID=3030012 RepID=UPI0023EE0FE7|nr:biopolymer transporter ExbD [Maribacter zhoushanensis]MDF4201930.1 biopolymer transporter ExbD [Maribacter zhoushanensis]
MIKFNKYRSSKSLPPVSTASLPDIVFILLFFFMTVTVMKNQNLLVENTLPTATETEKLDKKDRVIEIYIGKPTTDGNANLGDEPRIQMDNKFITVDEVGDYALQALSSMPQHLRSVATVSIKADVEVKMGVIDDLKNQLRKVNLLKINYTTYEGAIVDNL